MKQKMTYFAPETEQMIVRFEQNIMSTQNATSPGDMTTHTADDWGDWE